MCYGRFRSTAALAMTMAPSTWHEGCADKFIPDLTSRLEVANKKTTNQLRNLGAMRFKSEVAGIEKMDFRVRDVALVGFGPGINENGVIPGSDRAWVFTKRFFA